jgi:hypothetical protein
LREVNQIKSWVIGSISRTRYKNIGDGFLGHTWDSSSSTSILEKGVELQHCLLEYHDQTSAMGKSFFLNVQISSCIHPEAYLKNCALVSLILFLTALFDPPHDIQMSSPSSPSSYTCVCVIYIS